MYKQKLSIVSLIAAIGLVTFLNLDYLSEDLLNASVSVAHGGGMAHPSTVKIANQTKQTTNNDKAPTPLGNEYNDQTRAVNPPIQQMVSKLTQEPSFIETVRYANLSNEEKQIDLQKILDEEPIERTRVLLVPDRETTIASASQGQIIYLISKLGKRFKKGDLLIEFECNKKLANVDMAKADLAGAMEQYEAKVKMQGLNQASDVEVGLAASETNRAKAQLKLDLALASECKIFAPWSGRVAKMYVKQHMVVAAGEPLLDIIDSEKLKLKLNIPSKQLPNLKIGKMFKVNIDETNRQYSARISAINSQVDAVSQTVEVEALLINPNRALLAGMSGTASIPTSASNSQLAYH